MLVNGFVAGGRVGNLQVVEGYCRPTSSKGLRFLVASRALCLWHTGTLEQTLAHRLGKTYNKNYTFILYYKK